MTPTNATTDSNRNLLGFLLFTLLLLATAYSHLLDLWAYSQKHVHYTHFILIAPVTAYLLWTERRRVFADIRWSWLGIPLLLAGLAVWWLGGREAAHLSESGLLAARTFALWLAWTGGFVALLGPSAAWAGIFPLGFVLLAVPFPETILNAIVKVLQHGSVEVVDVLFKLLPIPVFRDGTIFSLPGLTIDVAPECSGIRSSIALSITALLAGYFFLRSNPRRLTLVAAAIPIAIFKNGLRIVTLVLLSIYWDPGFMSGGLHTRGGYPFFVLSLIFLAPVLWLLRRNETA